MVDPSIVPFFVENANPHSFVMIYCFYMKKFREVFFTKQSDKLFKGFGPAFLALALGIGSGEFILWPYLSSHYGFGILWGALLGITIQLVIVATIEKNTAFLGENILVSFRRVFKLAFPWILFSTVIGFGWPGFSAMSSKLLIGWFDISIPHQYLSLAFLVLAILVLILSKKVYKRILDLQKINMSLLLILVTYLFVYYFDFGILKEMIKGFGGVGDGFLFIPAGLSLLTFFGAIAYAGSGGNLLLVNSFFVEREKKGLVGKKYHYDDEIVPTNGDESIENAKDFAKHSWKQNFVFFWFTGMVIIILLSYVSYAVLYGNPNPAEDFTFILMEANVFATAIHPIVGLLFIISGIFALMGVQLGVLDFMGSASKTIKNYSHEERYKKISDSRAYKVGVLAMGLFGAVILASGIDSPKFLIVTGSVINAFAMGAITFLLYRIESRLLPSYLKSGLLRFTLALITAFYFGFFIYLVAEKFLF